MLGTTESPVWAYSSQGWSGLWGNEKWKNTNMLNMEAQIEGLQHEAVKSL